VSKFDFDNLFQSYYTKTERIKKSNEVWKTKNQKLYSEYLDVDIC